jgi:hypothetical protein
MTFEGNVLSIPVVPPPDLATPAASAGSATSAASREGAVQDGGGCPQWLS